MADKPIGLAVKAAIVDEAGRSLLIRRSPANTYFVGKWEWPGGKSDPGESFDEALIREVEEETGLEIEIKGLIGATEFEMPAVRVVLLCLEARLGGGELKLSHEHDQAKWVSPDAYKDMQNDFVDNVQSLMVEYAASKEG